MAGGMKKEELTLEEKLEQALVPVEEQPYEVPGNWCWTRWGMIGEFVAGNGFKKEYQGFTGYEIPFYKVGSLKYVDNFGYLYDESNTITEEIRRKLKAILIPRNSILFAKIGEAIRLNRRCLNKKECCIDNNTMAFITNNCNFKYVYYWTLGQEFYDLTNATTVPAIRKSDLELIKIPLPPLDEQQRIVGQIESLFNKLDEVKEKVQEVIAGIDNNVEALLYKAFTGQLTNDWRNSNTEIGKWEDTTLSEIVSGLKYGSSEKSDYEYKGTPILRIPNIGDGIVDFSDLKYMSEELKNSSHEVFEDDILIIRSNGSRDLVGKCALVPKLQERYAYASFLIRMKVTKKVLPEYLVRFINSSMARAQMFDKAKSSSGIHNINSKELGNIKICVPPIEEQKQILIFIHEIINREKKVQEISEEILDRIESIKKSILAKAFRGKLGTNNSDEESAIELLKALLMGA